MYTVIFSMHPLHVTAAVLCYPQKACISQKPYQWQQVYIWGISSVGRVPALHAGGAGIDAQVLHTFLHFFTQNYVACSPHFSVLLSLRALCNQSKKCKWKTTSNKYAGSSTYMITDISTRIVVTMQCALTLVSW